MKNVMCGTQIMIRGKIVGEENNRWKEIMEHQRMDELKRSKFNKKSLE